MLAAAYTLHTLQLDLLLYLLQYGENSYHDLFSGNNLDDVYTIYEEWANKCQREWMKLQVASEKLVSLLKAPGNSP